PFAGACSNHAAVVAFLFFSSLFFRLSFAKPGWK
ncbi:hypothetical protein ACN38_g12878, partial [Penicillium nordicum]